MPIRYSLLPRKSNLSDKESPWMIYAAAQSTETVDLRQIAHHIASHNSPFSEGTIIGLLTDFEKCIVEQLKRGARVDLGELGAFYTTLQGRGAESTEEFTTNLIDHIHVRWRISKEMDVEMQRTPLEFVINRADQRQRKRMAKDNLDKAVQDGDESL